MSDKVRTRLDQTYDMLPSMETQAKPNPVRSWKRRTASISAAAAILGVCVFASGFVSPAMADSIKQIPLIGSLFSSMEVDLGLKNAATQGMTRQANSTVSYKDVKLEVKETVFDGSRAVYALEVTAPNLKDGKYDNGQEKIKLSNAIEDIRFDVIGHTSSDPESPLNQSVQYNGAGDKHPNTLIIEKNFTTFDRESAVDLPDSIVGEMLITLQGMDQPFKLEVPFTKSGRNLVHLQPEAAATSGDLTLTINNLDITPLTTHVTYTLHQKSESTLTEAQQRDLAYTNLALYDDQGNLLDSFNGIGRIDGNTLSKSNSYASVINRPEYLIIKAFHNNDGDFPSKIKDKQFIKGLVFKIDLPAATE
ncbi:DUF4179 domain-containing protein [Paenibacillus albidus]|nr:DUF4179 domain-containing protein [Paenibacillus albidus]